MSPFPKIGISMFGILFDFRNIFPICFSFVHLRTVLGVNRQRFNSASCNLSATSSILIVSTSQPNLVFTVTGRCRIYHCFRGIETNLHLQNASSSSFETTFF